MAPVKSKGILWNPDGKTRIADKAATCKILSMGSRKKPSDAEKPTRSTGYRLRPQFQPLAERLADRRGYDITTLVNEAIRKELEREGMWPPPETQPKE